MDHQEVEKLVSEIAADVLAVDAQTLTGSTDLSALPTFSSFRVVTIVERAEDALGVEVDASELTPENLHRLDNLCELFVRATAKAV